MRETGDTDISFTLTRPQNWATGVIFASPHSGRIYPDWFLRASRLPLKQLRSSEDAFVDRLISCAPQAGAATICALYPRAFVDLNRGADELDPKVISGVPCTPQNQRTLSGLGVIPRVVSHGRAIYDRPMPRAEADMRLATYWRPYHDALSALIREAKQRFGQAILIDMHSMPHDALIHLTEPKPDIVLGNLHGKSASARVTAAISAACEAENWRVRRNSPFSGAYIATTYGQPARNIHVVQLEIDRSLYMDERAIAPLPCFDMVAARIERIIRRLAALDGRDGGSRPIAAE